MDRSARAVRAQTVSAFGGPGVVVDTARVSGAGVRTAVAELWSNDRRSPVGEWLSDALQQGHCTERVDPTESLRAHTSQLHHTTQVQVHA